MGHRELSRSYLGRLSVVGRWNKARYKGGKMDGNLNKSTFFYFGVLRSFLGSSLVLPWFVFCSSLVFRPSYTGTVQGKEILIKSLLDNISYYRLSASPAKCLCQFPLHPFVKFLYTLAQVPKCHIADNQHLSYFGTPFE